MIADYIAGHQTEFWVVVGFLLLVFEVVLGFVTAGALLFVGLGALMTGLLMWVGVLPETWIAGVACVGISTGLMTALLWKPLKKMQGDRPHVKDNSSDLVGYEFVVDSDITVLKPGETSYSGIAWKVEIDKDAGVASIQAGQRVSVSSVEVGMFKVKLAQ